MYYSQTYPQTNPAYANTRPMGLKGYPVSSIDEVRAAGIDFDGSIFFFPDLANKRIHTKQINLDGTASLNMYELKEIPKEKNNAFSTRDEFDNALKEIKSLIPQQQQPIQKDIKF